MRSAPSLSFDIVPSRLAQAALGVMLVLAFVSVWLSAMPVFVKNFLGIAVWIFGAGAWRAMLKLSLHRAVLQSDGIWLLSTPYGEIAAQLRSSSLLGNLIGLRWRDAASGAVVTLLLWPDSIDDNTRRLLRTWLRSGMAHRAESPMPDPGA